MDCRQGQAKKGFWRMEMKIRASNTWGEIAGTRCFERLEHASGTHQGAHWAHRAMLRRCAPSVESIHGGHQSLCEPPLPCNVSSDDASYNENVS
jgi:hypothetical protein